MDGWMKRAHINLQRDMEVRKLCADDVMQVYYFLFLYFVIDPHPPSASHLPKILSKHNAILCLCGGEGNYIPKK